MKKPVIKRRNLPMRLPVVSTAVAYLLLDRFAAAGWVWGVVGTVFALFRIGAVACWISEDEVDIFENPQNLQGQFMDRFAKVLKDCVKARGTEGKPL